MDINKTQYNKVNEYIDIAKLDSKYELEFVVQTSKQIHLTTFSNLITFFQKSNQYVLENHEETLDVRTTKNTTTGNIRMSIMGKDSILEYCKTGHVNISNTILIDKKRASEYPPIVISDYGVRVNMNEEILISNVEAKQSYIKTTKGFPKHFRYKKRYTFTHVDKLFKIDLTMVKSSQNHNATTMKSSNVLKANDAFEIEVEYLKNTENKETLNKMFGVVGNVIKIVNNVSSLISKTDYFKLLNEYIRLVDKTLLKKTEVTQVSLNKILESPNMYFLKYQPVTLEQENILDSTIDTVSIKSKYTVTEKADGERRLLFVSSNGKLYLLNNMLDIEFTGLHITNDKFHNSLLDGEYIKKGVMGLRINLFMVFDTYFVNGKDVRKNHLVSENVRDESTRICLAKQLVNEIEETKNGMTIKVKNFYIGEGDEIFQKSKNVLEMRFDYKIDGLIFTPYNLAPGALYVKDNTMSVFGGSWPRTYKWKPPDENSIDMLVTYGDIQLKEVIEEMGDDEYRKVKKRCVLVKMYVHYKGSLSTHIDVHTVLQGKRGIEKDVNMKREFDQCYLSIEDGNNHPKCKNGEKLVNETIVEFYYNSKSKDMYNKWIPLRIRHDKVKIYQNNIEANVVPTQNAANNYFTAINVWQTIQNPVTKDMIMGVTKLTTNDVKTKDELYYARDTHRERLITKPMLDFHNHWVKNKSLLGVFKDNPLTQTLFDIGCGKGGDMHKWNVNNFTTVVGVDNNEDNLLNPINGAYKRYAIEQSKKPKIRTNIVFLLMDGGIEWTDKYIESSSVDSLQQVTKIVFGLEKAPLSKSGSYLKKYDNMISKQFDVVSCQFAIHYFFESMDKIDAFCCNVNTILKEGGYFVGTVLDGAIVDRKFIEQDKDKITGVINEKVIWQLEKAYDSFDYSQPLNNVGKSVDVYMESINKVIREYLVDFELLKLKLEKYNIRVLNVDTDKNVEFSCANCSFETLWKNMKNSGDKHKLVQNSLENMTPIMKEYSFMNRMFVFKKYF